nr:cytoplasmic tRNA 2-thiolation protein 1-like [Loxodonta africana]
MSHTTDSLTRLQSRGLLGSKFSREADLSCPLGTPAMPAPTCASCHAARAALRRPRSGQALCGTCFCAAFEAEVLHTVLAGRLLPPGAVVAVGASGGKDSTVLAHVLRELAPRLGVSLRLVAVDEGIGGYRDAALAAVQRQAARWELPLTIVAYADLFGGWTMDAVARSTAGSGRSRACCTFCGVLRRRALEEGARLVGATHIVTGHNADDMAETVLMNFLRGDTGRLARGGGLGSPGEGGALPRCRPLQFASQKEVVLYAHFRRLDYFSEECVYAPEAFRGYARDLLKPPGGGCGPMVQSEEDENKMLGGYACIQNSQQWQAALLADPRHHFLCGGVLLSDQWAITATHRARL